jgi:DNA-binding response OmpR family regulator
MHPLRILVVEDHSDIVANIFEFFEARGHIMDAAPNGLSGLHLALTNEYDAIVLDIMLPGMDGIEVCRNLRQQVGINTPILMLTARDTLPDKLKGFEYGADDYMVKPFALAELEARILSLVRRAHYNTGPTPQLRVGELVFDLKTLEVSRAGHSIQLNPACRQILELLMREFPGVVTRKRIEFSLWGEDPPDSDALRAHIYSLRSAIDRPFDTNMLKTIHRVGYCLTSGENDA